MDAIAAAGRSLCSRPPSSPRSRGAKTATLFSNIARHTAEGRAPPALHAQQATVTRAMRIRVATAGTIRFSIGEFAICKARDGRCAVNIVRADKVARWPVVPERPRCRAAEQRDELAPLHSITSSARASSVGGKVTPSALAALGLMTSSTFVTLNPVF